MKSNKQSSNNIIVGVVIAAIFILLMRNFSLNNQFQRLQQDVNELQNDFNKVSQQLNTIIEMNSIVSDSEYRVEKQVKNDKIFAKIMVELSSNKLGSYTDLKLLYRTTYDFTKAENYDYSNESWHYTEVKNNNGKYFADFIVPFSCNYELKIAYEDNKNIDYEQLPNLDLYSKSEQVFMKGINIYRVNKSKLEFDVQIAKFKSSIDTKLLSAACNVYYDNDIVKAIDILKANEVSGRKEPRVQLEHLDGDYWFIIEEVDFSNIEKFDKSKVTIEIVLEDSIGNIYKMVRKVD
ncbi:hypothetical protein [Maledivibacter halophilus]|uniref:Uncharacterized protein n=1 Tax=Maledivibacter halophilus TaxID=36842 RepID=A0A1T5KY44_9FIRM|nr:hypothetical protein [Maledivibacter halophilus]SKC68732.1 hypothetical protein SAMN02194393_02179 [Maledivibacter halophilus]